MSKLKSDMVYLYFKIRKKYTKKIELIQCKNYAATLHVACIHTYSIHAAYNIHTTVSVHVLNSYLLIVCMLKYALTTYMISYVEIIFACQTYLHSYVEICIDSIHALKSSLLI